MKKVVLTLGLIAVCSIINAQTTYKIKKIKVEGNDGWDFLTVDEPGEKVYISHGNMVQVIDANVGKVIATIPDTKGVHGIALAPDFKKGFITNGKDTSVTVFSTETFKATNKVKLTGIKPDAILYDAFSHKVFVYNGKTNNATVIDAITEKVVATIPFEGNPEVSVSDGKGMVYVNIESKSMVTVINATSLKVEKTFPITGGEEPTGLAIDNATHRLFIGCANKKMIVMDAETGKVISALPIGEDCDGVDFDMELKRAYASCGEGTITVVKEEDANTFKVVETIETQKGAKTIAVNSKTHHIYTPVAEYEAAAADGSKKRKIKAGTFVLMDIEPVK